MATRYKFEYNGNVYEVEGPENATPEQLIAAVSEQQQPQIVPSRAMAPQPAASFAPQNVPYDVTQDMGGGERFLAGVGQSLARTGLGVRDLLGLTQPGEVEEFNRINAPLLNTGAGFAGSLTGDVGQIVGPGTVLKSATTVPQLLRAAPQLGAAARAFLPTTVPGAALQGGVIGALQPTEEGQSRALNVGIGTVAGGVGQAIPQFAGTARDILNTQRRTAQVLRGSIDNADEVIAGGVRSQTPNYVRTLGEETLNPQVVELERAARVEAGTAFANRELANKRAQMDALQRIAGTEQDLLDAIARRDAQTAPLRREALKAEAVDVNKALANLSRIERAYRGSPTVSQPIARVKQILANISSPARRDPIMAGSGAAPTNMQASMRDLYALRKEIGYMISGASPDVPQGREVARELIAAREAIDSVISRRVPEFGQYLREYQRLSGDVNQLQFGQELARMSMGAADTGTPRFSPAQFMRQTEGIGSISRKSSANRLAQRATGFGRARADIVASPEQLQAIQSLRNDIARTQGVDAITSSLAGRQSATASNEAARKKLVEQILSFGPTATAGLKLLEAKAQGRVAMAVADALANPDQARAILMRFPANERRVAQGIFNAIGISTGAQVTQAQPFQ